MNILEAIEAMKKGKLCKHDIWVYRLHPICKLDKDGEIQFIEFELHKDLDTDKITWENPVVVEVLSFKEIIYKEWELL